MLAFTFPGQGSQRPGMGRSWTDHPSWEVVEEASVLSGRDVAHLLTEADDEGLRRTSNAQLATFVLSLVALDAIEPRRVGTDSVCRTQPRGVLGARRQWGNDLRRRCPAGGRARRGDARCRRTESRNDGRRPRSGGRRREAACADIEGVWIANYNAPGQVVIAGTFEGVKNIRLRRVRSGHAR